MPYRTFLWQLTLITAATALLLSAMHRLPEFYENRLLSWLSLAFFLVLSFLMFALGRRTAAAANKSAFIGTVMAFVFGKMLLSILLIALYSQEFRPESRYFVVPFFLVYLVYTIFETYFLMKLGRQKPS